MVRMGHSVSHSGPGICYIMSRDDLSRLLHDIPRKLASELQGGFDDRQGRVHGVVQSTPRSPGSIRLQVEEEGKLVPVHCRDKDSAIQILVAPLTGCLWGEETSMARRPVERCALLARMVLGAERIARTEPHAIHRLIQMPLQDAGLSERDQPAERALAVGCRRVDQNARHLGAIVPGLRE